MPTQRELFEDFFQEETSTRACVDGNEVDFTRAMEGVSEAMKVLRELRENAPQPAPLSEREAFERDWEKRHAPVPINGRTHDDGRYGDLSIQDAWESWQARAVERAHGITQKGGKA